MQPLSSRSTWFYRAVLPSAAFFGMCAFTFAKAAPLGGALGCFAAFLLTAWFGFPLKNAALSSTSIRLGGMFGEIDVPAANLVRVVEHAWQRPQFLTLVFSPPTKWGGRVRIIPPIENFRYTVDSLIAAAKKQHVPNQSSEPTFSSVTSPAGQEPRPR